MPPPNLEKASQQETQRLLTRLRSLGNAWPSEPSLRDLSPQIVDTLLKHIGKQEGQRGWILICFLLICLVCELFDAGNALLLTMLLGLTAWCCYYFTGPSLFSMQRHCVYALTQTEDIRVLPTLINATHYKWGRHPEVLNAIRRQLPLVTAEHIGLLNDDVQMNLWYLAVAEAALKTEEDEQLARGAIQALAYIGNRTMLSSMQYYVTHSAIYQTQWPLHTIMALCLSLMETRLQRQEVPATLLRASDTPTSHSETLLRAAHASTPEPSAQLMRAATSETLHTET